MCIILMQTFLLAVLHVGQFGNEREIIIEKLESKRKVIYLLSFLGNSHSKCRFSGIFSMKRLPKNFDAVI